jgi:hypothetical protein
MHLFQIIDFGIKINIQIEEALFFKEKPTKAMLLI